MELENFLGHNSEFIGMELNIQITQTWNHVFPGDEMSRPIPAPFRQGSLSSKRLIASSAELSGRPYKAPSLTPSPVLTRAVPSHVPSPPMGAITPCGPSPSPDFGFSPPASYFKPTQPPSQDRFIIQSEINAAVQGIALVASNLRDICIKSKMGIPIKVRRALESLLNQPAPSALKVPHPLITSDMEIDTTLSSPPPPSPLHPQAPLAPPPPAISGGDHNKPHRVRLAPPVNRSNKPKLKSKLAQSFANTTKRPVSNPITVKVRAFKAPVPELVLTPTSHVAAASRLKGDAVVRAFNTQAVANPANPVRIRGASWTIKGCLKLYPTPGSSTEDIINHGLPILFTIFHGTSFRKVPPPVCFRAIIKAVLLFGGPTGLPISPTDVILVLVTANEVEHGKLDTLSSRHLIADANCIKHMSTPFMVCSDDESIIKSLINLRTVFLHGKAYKTVPFTDLKVAVVQCRKCWRYSHFVSSCKARTPTCGICASPHLTADHFCVACQCHSRLCSHSTSKCGNCDEAHLAFAAACIQKHIQCFASKAASCAA